MYPTESLPWCQVVRRKEEYKSLEQTYYVQRKVKNKEENSLYTIGYIGDKYHSYLRKGAESLAGGEGGQGS